MKKKNMKHFKVLFHKSPKRGVDLRLKQLAYSDKPLSICLTNDFAFKKIFRNKIALTGLLSCLLQISTDEIVDLEFPDTFLHGEFIEDHEGILDVKVHLNHSQKINIEIQVLAHPHWEERSLFYLCRLYAEDFIKGQDYGALEDCIHISILGFPVSDVDHLYSVVRLMDEKTRRIYSSKLGLRVLYLSKLDTCSEEDKCTEIYHWARLISAQDWRVLNEMAKRNKYMKEAVEELERLNADKELRYLYLMRLKAASDETTMRNYYEKIERNALEAKKGMKATKRELDITQKSLDITQKKLDTAQKNLDTTQKNLDTTQKNLDTTQKNLDTTKSKLDTTKSKLDTTKSELDTTKSKLDTTKSELDTTKSQLEAARISLKAKHLEGLREGQKLGIRAFIEDGLEDGKSREEIITRLQKRFSLDESDAAAFFDRYGSP